MTAAEDLRRLFETQRGYARVPGVSSQAFPHLDADALTLGTLRPRPLPSRADRQPPVSTPPTRRYLDHFFKELDYEPLRRFCQELCDCDGTVFFTGVGKSGFIANKISQTLVSTGTKSVYLNPTDALHGDIGIVGPSDILVLFSKSGASSELLSLVPYARAKGANCRRHLKRNLRARRRVRRHVLLPLERELCPFDLAPVTSTAIQMLFGDTCAVAVMRAKGLSVEAFG